MKKKFIIIIIISTILAILIYKMTYHEELTIVTLGDSISLGMTPYHVKGYSYNDYLKDFYEDHKILRDYITEFAKENETSETLLKKIETNEILDSTNLTIQQALSKAKIITISIGMDELNQSSYHKAKDFERYIDNIKKILKQLRLYNKKQIIMTSLYESKNLSEEQIKKLNTELKQLADQEKVQFIDIAHPSNEYFFNPKEYQMNYKGHHHICNLILEQINL